MKKVFIIVLAFLSFFMMGCTSTAAVSGSIGLSVFGADLGKKIVSGKDIRIPYTSLASYYGYEGRDSQADEIVKGKKMYYLYVWIPDTLPEIGIRMLSPAAGRPSAGDFTADSWETGSADTKTFFDTWIKLERAADIIEPSDIHSKINTTKWLTYGTNDDSPELPANPAGKKYNSLLRIINNPTNPTKALIRGLYRIGFTSYKIGDVCGSFIVQIGSLVDIPGLVIVKDESKILHTIEKIQKNK